jgi:hypothetical protein
MGRPRLGASLLLSFVLLGACSEPPGVSGVVTEKHHYPAHVKTAYSGACLPNAVGDDQPQPPGCTKNVKNYAEHWEICLRAKSGVATCYYVSDWDYRAAPVGKTYGIDSCCIDDPHPAATDEWDGAR